MAALLRPAGGEEVEEAGAEAEAEEEEEEGEEAEGLDRPVHAVGADDDGAVAADVAAHRAEQARGAGLRVGVDGDVLDGEAGVAGLDDGLEGVGEAVVDEDGGGGLATDGPKAAGGVAHGGAAGAADHVGAPALEDALEPREVGELVGAAVADDDVGAALEDRCDEAGDVGAAVLVVGVGVDDDVGAEAEAGVDAGGVGDGEAAVAREAEDVVDAELGGVLGGAVAAAVVDDEDLDAVDAGDAAREIGEGGPEVVSLVQAGDLDEELHGRDGAPCTTRPGAAASRAASRTVV